MKPFNCVQTTNTNIWNHLTVQKQMNPDSFKNKFTDINYSLKN